MMLSKQFHEKDSSVVELIWMSMLTTGRSNVHHTQLRERSTRPSVNMSHDELR